MKVIVYTDGSCINFYHGGWAYLMEYNNKQFIRKGYMSNTTNNKMELYAALQALYDVPKASIYYFFTDSTYLQKGITLWIQSWIEREWRVKNSILWKAIHQEIQEKKIIWQWIRGHGKNLGNNIVDKEAHKTAQNGASLNLF